MQECRNGQGCRFLSMGRCKFWHSPRTVSFPGSGRFCEFQNNGEVLMMSLPVDKIGLVMGKAGKTVTNICHKTGAYCHIIDRSAPRGAKYKDIEINGSYEAIERARKMIGEKIRGSDRPSTTPPSGPYGVHSITTTSTTTSTTSSTISTTTSTTTSSTTTTSTTTSSTTSTSTTTSKYNIYKYHNINTRLHNLLNNNLRLQLDNLLPL
jgi:polyribonucleotide nucleotidyltransferase